jgi:hypothetical protein
MTMSTAKVSRPNDEVAILGRLLLNGNGALSAQRARLLLKLHFSNADEARMNELAGRNQDGLLNSEEREELLGYAKAGCLLGILHSRARRALKNSTGRRQPR